MGNGNCCAKQKAVQDERLETLHIDPYGDSEEQADIVPDDMPMKEQRH